jgi:hypothetical protein
MEFHEQNLCLPAWKCFAGGDYDKHACLSGVIEK